MKKKGGSAMVEVRMEEKAAFSVCGKKTWISGQHNEEFARFWQEAHTEGLVTRLKELARPRVMERALLGVSRVEKDPADRAFFFYISCESETADAEGLERFVIPACRWAVFSAHGAELGAALLEAELFCHMTWLKGSGFTHANAPELEVYPEKDGTLVEYWLPVK